jgi:hypothetical protein
MNLKFDHLLSLCPPNIRARIENLRNVQQRPDKHPEGNVFIHTRIVVDRLAKYNSVPLSWAGMFHDIGKDVTTAIGPGGHLQAIGHELVSADSIAGIKTEFITAKVQFEEIIKALNMKNVPFDPHSNGRTIIVPVDDEWEIVEELCRYHMRIKLFDEMKLSKQMEMRRMTSFGLLQLFTAADDMSVLTQQEQKLVTIENNFEEIKKNLDLPPIEVRHQDLERTGDSIFRSKCPECDDGVLLMKRKSPNFTLDKNDTCIACGRRFIYTDIAENSMTIIYTDKVTS